MHFDDDKKSRSILTVVVAVGTESQLQRRLELAGRRVDEQPLLLGLGPGALVPREYVLHEAVLVARLVWTVDAVELGRDPALEVPVTLQVVLVFVGLAAVHTDVDGWSRVAVLNVFDICNKQGNHNDEHIVHALV